MSPAVQPHAVGATGIAARIGKENDLAEGQVARKRSAVRGGAY